MRRVLLATTLIASLAAAAPVFAEPTTDATSGTTPADGKPAKPAKAGAGDPNRMVCTREHVVGSNRPEKVCMTVAERERIRDASQRAIDSSLRPGPQNPGNVQGE